jgi:CSLREA domain-containing protein
MQRTLFQRKRTGLQVLLVSFIGCMILILSQTTLAATFKVNTTSDTNDSNKGNGSCRDSGGKCSLRAALEEANASANTTDTIIVPGGTYKLTKGQLVASSDILLEGAGEASTFVDAQFRSRVLKIDTMGGDVWISNFTFRNGKVSSGNIGGGILVTGGSLGQAGLYHCTVTNNSTEASGGGIANYAWLMLDHTTVSFNQTRISTGGGQQESGGGIMNFTGAILDIWNSTINTNTSTRGGGICNTGGTMYIENSTISGNIAGNRGGGILNAGATTITACTIAFNKANDKGSSSNELAIGGGVLHLSNTLTLANSIIAKNEDKTVYGSDSFNSVRFGPDISTVQLVNGNPTKSTGKVISYRGNVIGKLNLSSCWITDHTGSSTIFDKAAIYAGFKPSPSEVDPLLGGLAFWGGPTQTHRIYSDSPAINNGGVGGYPMPPTDQRDVPRPQGGGYDSGAYEN